MLLPNSYVNKPLLTSVQTSMPLAVFSQPSTRKHPCLAFCKSFNRNVAKRIPGNVLRQLRRSSKNSTGMSANSDEPAVH